MKIKDLKEGKYFHLKIANYEHVFCPIKIDEEDRSILMRAFYLNNATYYTSSVHTSYFTEIAELLENSSYNWKLFPSSRSHILFKCVFEEYSFSP